MRLSVIVPIYNERSTIQSVLDRLAALDLDVEIIVVDDGSTDGSREYLEERLARHDPVDGSLHLVVHEQNQGKGAAIRTGLQYVCGEAVIIQDADLEYDPAEIPRLLKPLERGEADIVYGSRFLGSIQGMHWNHWLANRILTITANTLHGARLTDEATGYKLFRTHVLTSLRLRCQGFEFCPEVTAKVLKQGFDIMEVPIHSYVARHLDKKISWQDGFAAFWVLCREKFFD